MRLPFQFYHGFKNWSIGHHFGLVRIFELASIWTALELLKSIVGLVNRLTCPILDELNGSKDLFIYLFPPLKNSVILTLKPIPSPHVHCSASLSLSFESSPMTWRWCRLHPDDVATIRVQSGDPTMMPPHSRWCRHHPTMTPLSLSFGSIGDISQFFPLQWSQYATVPKKPFGFWFGVQPTYHPSKLTQVI